MCGSSEAGSYLRLIDSCISLSLRLKEFPGPATRVKKKKKTDLGGLRQVCSGKRVAKKASELRFWEKETTGYKPLGGRDESELPCWLDERGCCQREQESTVQERGHAQPTHWARRERARVGVGTSGRTLALPPSLYTRYTMVVIFVY